MINVVVDKQGKTGKYDDFEKAWEALSQRFENTIVNQNFPGSRHPDEKGMTFPVNTDNKKLIKILRRMRRYNPIPMQKKYGTGYRQMPLKSVIEDPNFKDSAHSYYVQATDMCAYLLRQKIKPNSIMGSKSRRNLFLKLMPILCKEASSNDPYGIVWLQKSPEGFYTLWKESYT
ncbi:DUF3800 domain-containing protein [candidate division WOR-3 bacterium]|uniref:DUF3800 domain-containing protein n=1 Tax=candidate division WOR-3 bacterium TaxID=2052148 RepID=A0A9D5KAT0_UNCW3|nr:DUF3800 domain-containing protein [candidate division WOR-3 bacterium]MBD3365551.1 DUF3800 domain-containing protein [candidate division WOR-3 bacterium]